MPSESRSQAEGGIPDVRGRRVLLLQGPNGPFFRRLHQELAEAGAIVHKVHLNLAEQLYHFGLPGVAFRGALAEFPEFVEHYAREHRIDLCFLFGDCRPYHQAALSVLNRLSVVSYVFEEGYLRPDYVTVEQGGVNARSPMPRTPRAYLPAPRSMRPRKVRAGFAWSVLHTIINSLCVTLGTLLFPRYRHHRDVNTWRQATLWARSFYRRFVYARREAALLPVLAGSQSGKYFLLALQVHNDSQVRTSQFGNVRAFIDEAVNSFAAHAPKDVWLVVKHHPADRAYRDYGEYLSALGRRLGVADRLRYVHDLHLPTLLQHAAGTVVLNSTVGLSSLHHGTPVKAMAESIYGYMGLGAECSLEAFWHTPPSVDARRVRLAHRWLRYHNQANGSIWTVVPGAGATGLRWPSGLRFEGCALPGRATSEDRVAALPHGLPARGTSKVTGRAALSEELAEGATQTAKGLESEEASGVVSSHDVQQLG